MRRLVVIIFCILLSVSMAGCMSKRVHINSDMTSSSIPSGSNTPSGSTIPTSNDSPTSSDSPKISILPGNSNIPTNTSVNVAWGGGMCEANGYIYYVFIQSSNIQSSENQNPQAEIVRMNQDGSNPTVVSDKYDYINNLTADSNNLYFVGSGNAIFRLPFKGGKAQKVTDAHVRSLQNVKGKLYWIDNQDADIQIKCVNTDGSDLKTLIAPTLTQFETHAEFLATETGIYYSRTTYNTSDSSEYDDIYHTDLSGENPVKLNHDPLRSVFKLFDDQGIIYFLMQNDFAVDPFTTSVATLDKEGRTKIILNHVGYFPQDFSSVVYCGISNNVIYYFLFQFTNGSSAKILLDLHQFDINKNKDELILSGVDMGDSAVGTISSLRGKSIKGDSIGMYILGNDVYYETFRMP